MKTKCSSSFTAKMVLGATFFVIAFSCQKDVSKTDKFQSLSAEPVSNDAIATRSPYNLNVLLLGDGSKFGFVKFRQNADTAHGYQFGYMGF